MASRGSVRARVRVLLADELELSVRFAGLLLRLMLAGLAYKFCLIECLPGQYADATLGFLIGLSVMKLLPSSWSQYFRSFGAFARSAAQTEVLPHHSKHNESH